MPYVDPGAVTTGTTITSTWGNAVRNAEQYLANPPACRVYHSANQSIVASTETTLAFDSERYDTDTMHDTVTNNSRITIKTAGLFVVQASVSWAAGTGTWSSYATLRVNGSTVIDQDTRLAATGIGASLNPSATYKFAVNDYIEVRVWQNSGTLNLTATPNYSPEFSATWVGLG